MIRLESYDFSIQQIAESGQCFRIDRISGDTWEVKVCNKQLRVQAADHHTHIFHCGPKEYRDTWFDYFDLARDYGQIKASVLRIKDPYLINAVNYGYGIRILKQDLWEVIVSFIISQMNNIPRIKSIIKKLCALYDDSFPSCYDLAKYTESDFKNLGLGYRAEYLLNLVKNVLNGDFNMSYLKTLNYQEGVKYLKQLKGVGTKVANCIALFGLNKLEAFPRDVWINRILEKRYNGKFNIQPFSEYAGIIQQYMFFYERSLRNGTPT